MPVREDILIVEDALEIGFVPAVYGIGAKILRGDRLYDDILGCADVESYHGSDRYHDAFDRNVGLKRKTLCISSCSVGSKMPLSVPSSIRSFISSSLMNERSEKAFAPKGFSTRFVLAVNAVTKSDEILDTKVKGRPQKARPFQDFLMLWIWATSSPMIRVR